MSRLAVVIPAYNHAHFLRETLESVLNQTRQADRVLVLDDGSTDNSANVAREFADRGVEVEEQENAGAHHTLNRLIQKAAGDCELIAILNSDDQFLPDRFERCLDVFSKDKEAQLVCTPLELIDDDGDPLAADHPRAKWVTQAWSLGGEQDLSLASWLGFANFPATTSNIVARSAFLLDHPMRDYRYCHDYFLLASAAIKGVMRLVPGDSPLLRYRVHATNTISTAQQKLIREMLRFRLELTREYAPLAEKSPLLAQGLSDLLHGFWGNISSIPENQAQLLLGRALTQLDPETLKELIEATSEEALSEFPNKHLVNLATPDHPLGRGPELGRKVSQLTKDRATLKNKTDTQAALLQLRHHLSASKWLSLGNILGQCKSLQQNEGKGPEEKLSKLGEAIRTNGWIKKGTCCSKHCQKLLQLAAKD